ncbi:hypothetical protein C8A03DRAFT_46089 [Achaetomium macrosporum]|uniref:Uncharacterized protein n=1 Tax=Achaetomium macrosporum TaxID=79813 RepID=A0AAN7C5K0_9PEZI|nr:hypothetical protein C8A03DRAFT_46089 [Achaetomium macrosporum]
MWQQEKCMKEGMPVYDWCRDVYDRYRDVRISALCAPDLQSTSRHYGLQCNTSQPSRWASPISASANVDADYRQLRGKPDKAYAYICWCQPPFLEQENDNDEHQHEHEDDSCDAGKTCLCTKPAHEHPDHKWISTWAARCKFFGTVDMVHYRNLGNFGMHTFTDHEAYGAIEVFENLLLDFVESEGNWREQWVLCETLAFFLRTDLAEAVMMIDDPNWLAEIIRLVGRAFLAMLARLEREHRLGPNSEVRNLGLIMAMFVKVWADMPAVYTRSGAKEETVELRGHDGSTTTYTFNLRGLDEYITGYAERHSITLHGAFQKYEKKHGRLRGRIQLPTIGGDEYDITPWDAARRKNASLTGRDPFSQRQLMALRMGMTIQFA